MCGRFTLDVDVHSLLDRYDITDDTFLFEPRYNAAPRQDLPAILRANGKNRIGYLNWGLIPFFAEDDKLASKMINARSETITVKRSFRNLLQQKRVIIPANSFIEWQTVDAKKKQPMRIMMRDERIFSFAALYDTWQNEAGQKISTCTIITTRPNELVERIHDRMPVILKNEQELEWLNRDLSDVNYLTSMLVPYDANDMKVYPISPMIGNVRNDTPDCLRPLS
ncbi:SOS response-associated peptidase [Brevibacillus reuszeri]|uniref:SOS response-associated peptidase n=1 Tax=Brevibacillus reuszeri TaxID=54915 RepID=UPI000CCC881A|nr:SOS response-associated peptidase [Brevibacillus reuszeri]